MKKLNKILAIILAILMIVSIVPLTASAENLNYAGDSVYWLVKNGTLMIYGSGEMYSYTSSTAPWRSYKDKIKEISIDEDITSIGDYAFYGLNITKVEIPEGIRKIGTCAFANCTSLSEVVIRKGVEIIDSDAFANCTSLNNVYYYSPQNDWGLINIRTGNNYLLNAELIVNGDGQITWEFDTETGTLTFNGSGEIPDYYNEDEDYRIKQPWDEIKKDIKHLVINEGITAIGSHAFADCYSLESVAMSSVTTIDNGAFSYAESLESITMSNSIQIIENSAFHECVKLIYIYYLGTQEEWNNVSIGENLNDEFFSAKVYPSDYSVPTDSGTYSEPSFLGEQTVSWELDGNTCTLTIFGEGYIPDEVAPAIGSNMYKYAGYIRTWEPYKYDIKRIVITEGITRIGENVFRFFPNLTEVVIPTSVTEISNSAFCTCDSITDVYYLGTEEQRNNITIGTGNESLLNAIIHYNSTGPHTHDYEMVVTEPTCTEQGYTTYICACGYSNNVVDNYVDATGHSHTSEITVPATHTETGIMTYTCTCGDTYTEVIAKLEKHNYETVVTPPTCTEQGYITYTCECGDSYIDDYVDALGHSYDSVVTPPTCTENGFHKFVCSICNDSIVFTEENALGHNYADDYTVDVEPTYTSAGSKSRHCSRCDAKTDVTSIEKLYYKSKTYTGLYKVDGVWCYVKNGELDNTFTGLCKYSGKWYYVKKGVVDFTFTGLCKYSGKWYHVKDGVKTTYTGLVKHTDGKWYYVKSGVVDKSYTGLVKHTDGKWYHVKAGVKSSFTGLCKYSGKWYYVNKGAVDKSYTGLVKHTDGKWYHVKNGVKTTYTGNVKYNGKTYKVVKGVKV